MNKLQRLIYNEGERLVPYVTHGEGELVRHRSSYAFFHAIITADIQGYPFDHPEFTLADLGFGSGYGCALLSSLPGIRITGVDISKECETFARQYYMRSNVNYVIEDLSQFIPAAAPFDYVVSRGVLEHVPAGLNLIGRIRFNRRVMVDVPYDEEPGNEHHILTRIKEDSFANIQGLELFYEDIEGRIFDAAHKPEAPNMVMAVISAPELPMVDSMFQFPIEPVTDTRLEEQSGVNVQGRRHYYPTAAELLSAIERTVKETEIALDLGCGIRPMNYFRPKLHLLVEPWREYADILTYRHAGDKSVIVLRAGALEVLRTLGDNSVDSIFLLDVIEHLEKDIGLKVIEECERVAREQVVLFTPLGFMPQHVEIGQKDGWGLSGNAVQTHLSGWEPEDFSSAWSFHICENFHTHDFAGSSIPEPYGAFFAIRNFERKAVSIPGSMTDFRHPTPAECELAQTRAAHHLELDRVTAAYQLELQRRDAAHSLLSHNYDVLLNSRGMRAIRLFNRILARLRFTRIK